jgi:hypothetical protein
MAPLAAELGRRQRLAQYRRTGEPVNQLQREPEALRTIDCVFLGAPLAIIAIVLIVQAIWG